MSVAGAGRVQERSRARRCTWRARLVAGALVAMAHLQAPAQPAPAASAPAALAEELAKSTVETAKLSVETMKDVYVALGAVLTSFGLLVTGLAGWLSFLGYKSLTRLDRDAADVQKTLGQMEKELDAIKSKRQEIGRELEQMSATLKAKLAEVDRTVEGKIEEAEQKLDDVRLMAIRAGDAATLQAKLSLLSVREVEEEVGSGAMRGRLREMVRSRNARMALEQLRDVQDEAARIGNERIESWALSMRSIVHLERGDFDEAIRLALVSKSKDEKRNGDRAFNLGYIYARRSAQTGSRADWRAAVTAFAEAFAQDPTLEDYVLNDPELTWYLGKGDPQKLRSLTESARRLGLKAKARPSG